MDPAWPAPFFVFYRSPVSSVLSYIEPSAFCPPGSENATRPDTRSDRILSHFDLQRTSLRSAHNEQNAHMTPSLGEYLADWKGARRPSHFPNSIHHPNGANG